MSVAMQYGNGSGGQRNTGITMNLLWTNDSPTSNFAAQTVSLDLSGYSAIVVAFATSTTSGLYAFSNIALKDGNPWFLSFLGGASTYRYGRSATVTNTGVEFSNGYRDGSASSAQAIPLYIYGIRGIT